MEADADTGRAQAQLAADRFRVEVGDVAQADQGPIPVVEVSHGVGEIDESRPVGITRARRSVDGELADRPTTLAAHDLAGLVGGDRHEPGLEPGRVAKGAEPAPGDRPGGLLGIGRHVEVAGYEIGDAGHVLVVDGDDPGERDLVACGGSLDDHPRDLALDHCATHDHAL